MQQRSLGETVFALDANGAVDFQVVFKRRHVSTCAAQQHGSKEGTSIVAANLSTMRNQMASIKDTISISVPMCVPLNNNFT